MATLGSSVGCTAPVTTAHPDLPHSTSPLEPANLDVIATKNLATQIFPGTRRIVGVRGRLTERSTGVQVCPVNNVWMSRYRDFGRPRLEFVLELY